MTLNPRLRAPFVDATSTVYGVATARMADDHHGAHLLVVRYLQDANAAGVGGDEAMSILLAAAVVALTDEMSLRAQDHGVSPMSELASTALAHAAFRAGS